MAFQEKQIAQARENSTNAVSVYSPGADVTAAIKTIHVCNTTGSVVKLRLFHDDDGTTYDQSTALEYDIMIPANGSYDWDGFLAMNDQTGNLAYRSDTANALTITVYGSEIT